MVGYCVDVLWIQVEDQESNFLHNIIILSRSTLLYAREGKRDSNNSVVVMIPGVCAIFQSKFLNIFKERIPGSAGMF